MADSSVGHAVLLRSPASTTDKDNLISSSTTASLGAGVRHPSIRDETTAPTKKTRSSHRPTTRLIAHNNNNSKKSAAAGGQVMPASEHDSTVNEEDGETDMKRRRTDRCDSSESSDSGVASLTCSDASPWSSSSDSTEPMSPIFASPMSPEPSPVVDHGNGSAGQEESNAGIHLAGTSPMSAAQMTNRRRRYSDSVTPESLGTLQPVADDAEECCCSGKRARRLSGESTSVKGREGRFGLSLASLTANFKWLSYIWRNKETEKDAGMLDDADRHQCKHLTGHSAEQKHRHSWPMTNKRLQTSSAGNKKAQLKITEFFSSQVKNNWTYSKFAVGLKELRERLPPAEPAIPTVPPPLVPIITAVDSTTELLHGRMADPPDCAFTSSITATSPPQIRFPANHSGSKGETAAPAALESDHCLWKGCMASLDPGESLLEHIQTAHVAPQALVASSGGTSTFSSNASSPLSDVCSAWAAKSSSSSSTELYACEWEGCKVQGRKSSSRTWLERHVLLHGGHKPFRCIVDSCGQRFNSQAALERHVNAHFNQDTGHHQGTGGNHGLKRDNLPAKIIRRNSKKLKNNRRSRATPGRLLDYFDAGIMERLRHQLWKTHNTNGRSGLSPLDGSITVCSQIIARRLDLDGKTRVLLKWSPANVLPDQWVLENEVEARKNVPLRSLSPSARIQWHQKLVYADAPTCVKQRRK